MRKTVGIAVLVFGAANDLLTSKYGRHIIKRFK